MTGWGARPPCASNPELWFAEGNTREAKAAREQAIQICKHCPMLAACTTYAADVKPAFGVWAGRFYPQHGGSLPVDRLVAQVLSHGTEAGLQRHRRKGERPCAACRGASAWRKWEERSA